MTPVTGGILNTNQKLGLEVGNKKKSWREKLAGERHTGAREAFFWRRVICIDTDDIWCADLDEMQPFSKWKKGYTYFLIFLDIFSKYGWFLVVKNRSGETVAAAIRRLLNYTPRRPKKLWVDTDKE